MTVAEDLLRAVDPEDLPPGLLPEYFVYDYDGSTLTRQKTLGTATVETLSVSAPLPPGDSPLPAAQILAPIVKDTTATLGPGAVAQVCHRRVNAGVAAAPVLRVWDPGSALYSWTAPASVGIEANKSTTFVSLPVFASGRLWVFVSWQIPDGSAIKVRIYSFLPDLTDETVEDEVDYGPPVSPPVDSNNGWWWQGWSGLRMYAATRDVQSTQAHRVDAAFPLASLASGGWSSSYPAFVISPMHAEALGGTMYGVGQVGTRVWYSLAASSAGIPALVAVMGGSWSTSQLASYLHDGVAYVVDGSEVWEIDPATGTRNNAADPVIFDDAVGRLLVPVAATL